MDDALLVGVLDRLANRYEQFQPLLRGQPVAVAVLGDRHTLDQLHHEVRPAVVQPAVEHLGDVRVVHERQRLPLGVEPGQHLLRVHPGLDQFDRDKPLDRLGLPGPPDRAHAPLADQLDQRVLAGDDDPGLLVSAAIVVDNESRSGTIQGLIAAGPSQRRVVGLLVPALSVPEFRGGVNLALIEGPPIEQRFGTEVRVEEMVEPQAQLGTAGALALQQGGAFGRVGDGDGGGEQVEFVHRMGPPTRLA